MQIFTKKIKNKSIDTINHNIVSNIIGEKKYLGLKENTPLTKNYYDIEYLGNDHYAVCELKFDEEKYLSYDYYQYQYEKQSVNFSFKWGVIKINRNASGEIMPFQETLIFPFVYDRISPNNENTATAYASNHLTYLDFDQNRNYGKQLCPVILDHAAPFNTNFEGFAECSINGKVGYLPRNIKSLGYIDESYLLSYEQVLSLIHNKPSIPTLNLYRFLTKEKTYEPLTRKRIPHI